jgi:hypothetical protein
LQGVFIFSFFLFFSLTFSDFLSFTFSSNATKVNKMTPTNTLNLNTTSINQQIRNSTTNSMILDYLFYQSIQSRLAKAITFDNETSDKNVIESVIDGKAAAQ